MRLQLNLAGAFGRSFGPAPPLDAQPLKFWYTEPGGRPASGCGRAF